MDHFQLTTNIEPSYECMTAYVHVYKRVLGS